MCTKLTYWSSAPISHNHPLTHIKISVLYSSAIQASLFFLNLCACDCRLNVYLMSDVGLINVWNPSVLMMNTFDRQRSSNVHHWVYLWKKKKPQLSADAIHMPLAHKPLPTRFFLLFIVFAYTSAVTFCSCSLINELFGRCSQEALVVTFIREKKLTSCKEEQSSQSYTFLFISSDKPEMTGTNLLFWLCILYYPPTVLFDIHVFSFFLCRQRNVACVIRLTGTAGPSYTHEPVILKPHFLTTHFLTHAHVKNLFLSPPGHRHRLDVQFAANLPQLYV